MNKMVGVGLITPRFPRPMSPIYTQQATHNVTGIGHSHVLGQREHGVRRPAPSCLSLVGAPTPIPAFFLS